jgi:hypothetical protein
VSDPELSRMVFITVVLSAPPLVAIAWLEFKKRIKK